MKTGELRIATIEPMNENNWLTQKNLQENHERIFSKKIFLAPSDSEDSYIEVDNAYKDAWEEAERERMEAEHPPIDEQP